MVAIRMNQFVEIVRSYLTCTAQLFQNIIKIKDKFYTAHFFYLYMVNTYTQTAVFLSIEINL